MSYSCFDQFQKIFTGFGMKFSKTMKNGPDCPGQSNHPYQWMLSHCFELTCRFCQFLNNFHRSDKPNLAKQHQVFIIISTINDIVHLVKISIRSLYVYCNYTRIYVSRAAIHKRWNTHKKIDPQTVLEMVDLIRFFPILTKCRILPTSPRPLSSSKKPFLLLLHHFPNGKKGVRGR